ncbi:hypothetical protein KIN20_002460 [Parelaphostrongylus tenuis]|uniref:ZP domain-containing protein n=1 Tax=Parelaphostrongylus tenuis TaxID=148309 RepID=A0AAD5QFB8_PARTN|nr:hypothetical protein KIN20_002460 [Parelaphostrongylus tenuis]
MLIHSCLVDDGQGNQFELIDDRGCSKDSYLLPQIIYDPHSLSAFTDAHVFKYADKVQIYFTCTVQLCYKHDGGCDGVTPPVCDNDPKHLSDIDASHELVINPPQELEGPHKSSIPSKEIHGFEAGDSFQDDAPFIGPPPDGKEFFGPIDIVNEMRRYPYKDSPLNETEANEVAFLRWNTTTDALFYGHKLAHIIRSCVHPAGRTRDALQRQPMDGSRYRADFSGYSTLGEDHRPVGPISSRKA